MKPPASGTGGPGGCLQGRGLRGQGCAAAMSTEMLAGSRVSGWWSPSAPGPSSSGVWGGAQQAPKPSLQADRGPQGGSAMWDWAVPSWALAAWVGLLSWGAAPSRSFTLEGSPSPGRSTPVQGPAGSGLSHPTGLQTANHRTRVHFTNQQGQEVTSTLPGHLRFLLKCFLAGIEMLRA